MHRVFLIDVDDWAQLWVDGECVHEGHSIPDFVFLEVMKGFGIDTEDKFIENSEFEDGFDVESYMEELAKEDWENWKTQKLM